MKYSFAILKNENEEDHRGWIRACENSEFDIRYTIIDITKHDWLVQATSLDFDCYLTRPPGTRSHFKQLYDERIYILHRILGRKIYPTYDEILIYENKRMLAYWLKANNIPHPKTWIFYHTEEAMEFANSCALPVVAKTAIGASGSGVRIIKRRNHLKSYIEQVFSEKGVVRKWGPNLRRGDIWRRFFTRIKDIPGSYKYFRNKYTEAAMSPHRWFVIFQEYIKCDFEWRAVRIGDSYFAHKKIRKKGEMFSGTSEVKWDGPSEQLLDFVKFVSDKGHFLSQAMDIFEDERGQYFVNELQCFFGSKNPHQMILNGKPGRYVYRNDQWIFEEGSFNTNNSFDLRLQHAIHLVETNGF